MIAVASWVVFVLDHLRDAQPLGLLIGLEHKIRLLSRVQLVVVCVLAAVFEVVVVARVVAGRV